MRSGCSSMLPIFAAKEIYLSVLLSNFNAQLIKKDEHQRAIGSKELSKDWSIGQMIEKGIMKIYTRQQPLMGSTVRRALSAGTR